MQCPFCCGLFVHKEGLIDRLNFYHLRGHLVVFGWSLLQMHKLIYFAAFFFSCRSSAETVERVFSYDKCNSCITCVFTVILQARSLAIRVLCMFQVSFIMGPNKMALVLNPPPPALKSKTT